MAKEIVKRIYIVLGLTILAGLGVFLVIPFSDASKRDYALDELGEEIIQSPFLMASYLYMFTCIGPFFAEVIPGRVFPKDSNNKEFRICQIDIYLVWLISFAITPLMSVGSVFSGCSPRTVGMINTISIQTTAILFTGSLSCSFWTYKETWTGIYPTGIVAILGVLYLTSVYCDTIVRIRALSDYYFTIVQNLAVTATSTFIFLYLLTFAYFCKKYMESDGRDKDTSEVQVRL